MPTQLAFDGETLEAALARVNEEVGPDARITHADKVRTGGIAGFFARERFEVMVEVDEPSPAVAAPAPDPVPQPPPARSLLDLVDEVSAQERSGLAPEPEPEPRERQITTKKDWWTISSNPQPIPTSGRAFHDVLRSVATDAGLLDQSATAAPAAGGAGESTSTPPAAGPPLDDPVPVTAETLVALGIPRALLGPGEGRVTPASRVLTAMEQIPDPDPLIAGSGDVVVIIGDGDVARQAAVVAAAQLGLSPDAVVVAGMDRRGFETPDDGEGDGARGTRRAVVRSEDDPLVVAACVPPTLAGTRWAQNVLDALDPVAVWAAVRADRKPEDVAAWTAAIGGSDALAVGACDETVSPAAVLGAGLPVAVLEGRRSTAAAWTALLVERLTP